MIRIETVFDVNAPIEMLWQILLDLGAYGNWCASISFWEGSRVSEGTAVPVQTLSPDGSGKVREGKVTIDRVDTCRELVWKSGFFPLRTERQFWKLHTLNPVKTRLTIGAEIGGLSTLFSGADAASLYRPYYETIGSELKTHAEARFIR